jgi:acetyl-CoA C-acetyltransferase
MADAFVYDAVRTPRGRGKKDGSLHEVPAVRLGAKVLEAVRDRNGLDTTRSTTSSSAASIPSARPAR